MSQKLFRTAAMLIGFFSADASSDSIIDTEITAMMFDKSYGDQVLIKTKDAHPGDLDCFGSSWSFVLPLTANSIDDKYYAMLLAAQTAGRTVTLTGYGHCNDHSGIETLRRIEFK